MTTLYDTLADLPLDVAAVSLDRHEMDVSAGFTRVTTVIALHGNGMTGRGEDVTYETVDHERLREAHESGALDWNLAGSETFDSFSTLIDDVDLFPTAPERPRFRRYRRWALESAALDLALRQAETDFASALGRSYDPVDFVVSTRLDSDAEPTADRVHDWLDVDSNLAFKLDPTPDWNRDLCAELAATERVRILDFKNYYEGTDVDADLDPALYRRVVDAFPEAVLEDAKFTDETREILDGVHGRLSWDYPITSAERIRELPVDPEWLNIKPSRFGTVESLLEAIEYCQAAGITMYGGGQYELGVGREHLHAIASVFHPDGPNDIAPGAYNVPEPHADVPARPLDPPTDPVGLRWADE